MMTTKTIGIITTHVLRIADQVEAGEAATATTITTIAIVIMMVLARRNAITTTTMTKAMIS